MEHLVHFDMVLDEVFDLNDLCVEKSFLLSSIEELSLSSLSSHRLRSEQVRYPQGPGCQRQAH